MGISRKSVKGSSMIEASGLSRSELVWGLVLAAEEDV